VTGAGHGYTRIPLRTSPTTSCPGCRPPAREGA